MICFRIAVVALLVAFSGPTGAADAPVDAEKLRSEVARLTAANVELTKKLQEAMLAKASCLQVLDQVARASKDD